MLHINLLQPSEPHFRRGYSPTSGGDSVVVIFAASNNHVADSSSGSSSSNRTAPSSRKARETRHVIREERARVGALPFQEESLFQHARTEQGKDGGWTPDALTGLPADDGDPGIQIPPLVWRMVYEPTDPSPSPAAGRRGARPGGNASKTDGGAKPGLPQDAGKAASDRRPRPDWVLQSAVLSDGGRVKPDLPPTGKPGGLADLGGSHQDVSWTPPEGEGGLSDTMLVDFLSPDDLGDLADLTVGRGPAKEAAPRRREGKKRNTKLFAMLDMGKPDPAASDNNDGRDVGHTLAAPSTPEKAHLSSQSDDSLPQRLAISRRDDSAEWPITDDEALVEIDPVSVGDLELDDLRGLMHWPWGSRTRKPPKPSQSGHTTKVPARTDPGVGEAVPQQPGHNRPPYVSHITDPKKSVHIHPATFSMDTHGADPRAPHVPGKATKAHKASRPKDNQSVLRLLPSNSSLRLEPGGKGQADAKLHADMLHGLNLTAWKAVHRERRRLVRTACQDQHSVPRAARASVTETKAVVDRRRNLLYCPVAGAASDFFQRFLYSLKVNNRSREVASPLQVPEELGAEAEFDTPSLSFHRKALDEFMASSVKLVMVREPFSRLYTTYVDRLLVPDALYWKRWAVPAIARHRKYPSNHSLTCGHDLTFAEFVKYVIEELHESDDDVKPVSTLCVPCEVHYSVIGHVDTLTSDFVYLTSLLKLTVANLSAESFAADVIDDAIMSATKKAFDHYNGGLDACIPKYELGKRLWRKLQTDGVISDQLKFSFAPKKVEKMTATEFVEMVREARQVSGGGTGQAPGPGLAQQRAQAVHEAFKALSGQDVMKLVNIYSADFDMFAYDKHPSFLANSK